MLKKIYFAFLMISLVGCGVQTFNSSSGDASMYKAPVGSGGTNFDNAISIFANNCARCHSYASMSEDQFVSQGLVVKGNSANSKIYYRLNGSSGSNGPKDMPQSSGALSPDEVTAIQTWIDNML